MMRFSDSAARPWWVGLVVVYGAFAFLCLGPVLDGGFVSDDAMVIVGNPYLQELSAENVVEILDPFGPAVIYSMNYAPVHLGFHALERAVFGDSAYGYHLVNMLLHIVGTMLFVLLLLSSRLPLPLAASAGALFLVHPANAEAVAMAFQAKTLLSTALAFAAILAFWRHPFAAVALFGLALLTKIAAAFALPMVAVLYWVRSSEPQRSVPSPAWLLAWTGVLLLVAVPEFAAFSRIGQHTVALGDGLLEQARTIVAFAARYLVMAASGYGVSASHSPDAVQSWSDPWWLGGLVALTLLAWRSLVSLLRRQEEAAWWIAAAVAYAPVSQVFPFQYPMADRYLYMVLPGLIGGALLASIPLAGAATQRGVQAGETEARKTVLIASVALVALALLFAVNTRTRSPIFVADRPLMLEAAENYPNGLDAWLLEYEAAANRNDLEGTRAALRALNQRGYRAFQVFESSLPEHLARDPQVRAIIREMAASSVGRYEAIEDPHGIELVLLGEAYLAVGRPEQATEAAERALALGERDAVRARAIMRRARMDLYRDRRPSGTPSESG